VEILGSTTGPIITNVSSTILSSNSVSISWTTSESGTSIVDYGQTTSVGQTSSDLSLITSHNITLNNLAGGTVYYFRVSSANINGYSTTDNNNGNFYAFTTPSPNNFIPPQPSNPSQTIQPKLLEIDESKILLNNNNPFTREQEIKVTINLGGITKLKIGNEINLNGQPWQPFTTELLKEISSRDGTKSIYFQFQNQEGDLSSVIEKTIVLDTTPPSAPFNLEGKYLEQYIKITFQKSKDSDIAGARVFKSQTGFIINPFSDTEIISEGKSETIFDNNVSPNKTYYYSVFNYDYARNYSSPALVAVDTFLGEKKQSITSSKGVKISSFDWLNQNLNIALGSKLDDLSISQKTFHYLEATPINITIYQNDFLKNPKTLLLKVGDKYLYGLQPKDQSWTAKIDTPSLENNLLLTLEIIYQDNSKEVIELGQILIDPFGYVYQDIAEPHLKLFRKGIWSWDIVHKQIKLESVKIFLYQYNNNIKDWQLFEASRYGQKNPQITNREGTFGFLVPNGNYYLEGIKIGFGDKTTEAFEVKNEIVNKNIELSSIIINWWFVPENRTIILIIVFPIVLILAIIMIRAIKKRKKINVIYDGFSIK
jgi:hypothetical protein